MSKLEEAKRRFKVGDRIKSTFGSEGVITGNIHLYIGQNVFASVKNEGDLCLYDSCDNTWATVIKSTFTQDDIKPNMKVKLRDGDYGLVVEFKGELNILTDSRQWLALSELRSFKSRVKECDVVEIIRPEKISDLLIGSWMDGETVWKEEEEVPEYTVEELQEKLGCKFKIKGND